MIISLIVLAFITIAVCTVSNIVNTVKISYVINSNATVNCIVYRHTWASTFNPEPFWCSGFSRPELVHLGSSLYSGPFQGP